MPNPALIIFDIDGTLLQSHLITVPAVRQAFKDFGLAVPDEDAVKATFGIPVNEYEAWPGSHAPGFAEDLVAATNQRELELISECGELYPGAVETLSALRDAGHALATCSNGSIDYVAEALDSHDLRPFFKLVRCIGQGYSGKTAMVRDIMDRIEARPAIVVGDREGDISAAHDNEALAVAATYGFGSAKELANADAHIASLDQLSQTIVGLITSGV
jgi:phosphoglycolate phosphatase